jgi:Dolichyl-phosphate-mannose-protein mannosyltransferase
MNSASARPTTPVSGARASAEPSTGAPGSAPLGSAPPGSVPLGSVPPGSVPPRSAPLASTAGWLDRQPAPRLGLALIAAAAVAVELAVSTRYGFVRDELYFLAAGHHLAFGYVDQPALTPLLARISSALTGDTVVGLRVLPALALGAMVLLTAAMSRRLGAGRTGQLLAALAAATCGEFVAAAHELTTTTPDFLFWTITLYLVVRLLASRDPRWWLAIGGCAGVASAAKWNIGFLAAGLLVGFVATDARPLLRSRYLLMGCLIAVVLAAPDLVWQAALGWPNMAVFHALQGQAGHNRATYWPAQVLFTGLALTPVWVTGLIWSLRNAQARSFRPVGIACAIAIVVQFVLGGKAYYVGGAYSFLLAAGCIPVERWLADRKAIASRIRPATAVAAAMLASALLFLPVALPVLPAGALRVLPLQKINYDLAESIGWPREVALVAHTYSALPASQRRLTTILTGNYGEAGAIERYGAQFGLPQAFSGANNFWLWGPPPAADTTAIAVNVDPNLLRHSFTHVRQVAAFWNGLGVSDDEQGAAIYLATGLRAPWTRVWPAFRNYS